MGLLEAGLAVMQAQDRSVREAKALTKAMDEAHEREDAERERAKEWEGLAAGRLAALAKAKPLMDAAVKFIREQCSTGTSPINCHQCASNDPDIGLGCDMIALRAAVDDYEYMRHAPNGGRDDS